MIIEIKIPSPGESITQVQIASWLVKNGDFVDKNDELAEIESDKATFAISAPESGIISISALEGATVDVGAVVATINSDAEITETNRVSIDNTHTKEISSLTQKKVSHIHVTPLAKKVIDANKLDPQTIYNANDLHRIGRKDVINFLEQKEHTTEAKPASVKPGTVRIKMSPLRKKLAERLVAVKQKTAMLTTFNEVNMAAVLNLKNKYNEPFKQKLGYSLGFTSFFAKAAAFAIKDFPVANAIIDHDDIVFHEYADINIAVTSPKGLITPLIRNVELLNVPQIEQIIKEYGIKASKNRISLDDLVNGTFTISNGGVFGSLMSTPILNPPQSAILGLHKINERAMVVDGKIEILPMMYIALSYDHRLIDGKESVGFVMRIKELIEQPLQNGLTNEKEFDDFLAKPVL